MLVSRIFRDYIRISKRFSLSFLLLLKLHLVLVRFSNPLKLLVPILDILELKGNLFRKFHIFSLPLPTKTASIACQLSYRPPPLNIPKPQKFEFDSYGSIFARTLEQCGKSVAFYNVHISNSLLLVNIPSTFIRIRIFGLFYCDVVMAFGK